MSQPLSQRLTSSNRRLMYLLLLVSSITRQASAQTTRVFDYSGSIDTFNVPVGVTSLTVTAKGAQGGISSGRAGGLGAVITGTVSVTGGQVLNILVGQQPDAVGNDGGGGGGGGSFVTTSTTNSPLIVAGGGGGGGENASALLPTTARGQITNDGAGVSLGGAGGTNGSGGGTYISFGAGGGGGLLGDGGSINNGGQGGKAFINGGQGGQGGTSLGTGGRGGFGGGGGGDGQSGGGGGGGGYSGGGGACYNPSGGVGSTAGGGGGSYYTGASQINTEGTNTGNGQVTITYFSQPSSLSITGVTTVSCLTVTATERRVSFTPLYSGVTGDPISFSVINELTPTTAPAPYSLRLYTDNPVITLVAQQGTTEARYTYNWLAACTSSSQPASLSITGVTTVSCQTVTATERRLSFTPLYSGQTAEPISFSVVNELLPTTQPGPYALRVYIDNPVITLVAQQAGQQARFSYNWLASCTSSNARRFSESQEVLQVSVLGNPVRDEQVSFEVRGANAQPLQLRLLTPQGNVVSQRQVAEQKATQRYELSLSGQAAGMFLLQVSTPNQTKTVKVIKAQ